MPDNPEPEPHGKIASSAREIREAAKVFGSLTVDQGIRLVLIFLVVIIAGAFGWGVYADRNDRGDERARQERYYEGRDELNRQANDKRDKQLLDWCASENEKSRQHCQHAEEKQRKFLADELEKMRIDREKERAMVQAWIKKLDGKQDEDQK